MAKISAATFTQKEAILDKLKAEVAAERDRVARRIHSDFAAVGEREKTIVESIMEEDFEPAPTTPPPQSTATERPAEGSNARMNEFHEHREQIYVQDDPPSDEEAGENDRLLMSPEDLLEQGEGQNDSTPPLTTTQWIIRICRFVGRAIITVFLVSVTALFITRVLPQVYCSLPSTERAYCLSTCPLGKFCDGLCLCNVIGPIVFMIVCIIPYHVHITDNYVYRAMGAIVYKYWFVLVISMYVCFLFISFSYSPVAITGIGIISQFLICLITKRQQENDLSSRDRVLLLNHCDSSVLYCWVMLCSAPLGGNQLLFTALFFSLLAAMGHLVRIPVVR